MLARALGSLQVLRMLGFEPALVRAADWRWRALLEAAVWWLEFVFAQALAIHLAPGRRRSARAARGIWL